MNCLQGTITEIIEGDSLALIKVDAKGTILTSIVIYTSETAAYLATGNTVKVLFKETEVMIAHSPISPISIQNKLECRIEKLHTGKLLCELTLLFGTERITSIITKNAAEGLNLKEGDTIIALIKTNEVSLSSND